MSKEGPGAYPPLCVMDAFRKRVAEHGDEEVFYRQEGETWVATKWSEYRQSVDTVRDDGCGL